MSRQSPPAARESKGLTPGFAPVPAHWRLCPAPRRPYPWPDPGAAPSAPGRKGKGFAQSMTRVLIAGLVARSGGAVDPAWFGGPSGKARPR